MQFAAHARLEFAEGGLAGGAGGDRRRIFRMEIAPPVDVVAQEFDDEFFEQAVVLAVRAEEAGVQGRRRHGASACRMPSGWCARATKYMKPKVPSAAAKQSARARDVRARFSA